MLRILLPWARQLTFSTLIWINSNISTATMQMTAVPLPLILLNQEITLNYGSWQLCILYLWLPSKCSSEWKGTFYYYKSETSLVLGFICLFKIDETLHPSYWIAPQELPVDHLNSVFPSYIRILLNEIYCCFPSIAPIHSSLLSDDESQK